MIGNHIRELRIINKYTQEDLANKLKISKSTIGMYEQNRRSPDLKTLLDLSDIFNVSTDSLLGKTALLEENEAYSNISDTLTSLEIDLLNFYRLYTKGSAKAENKYGSIIKFFPSASLLSSDEKELLSYYYRLSPMDKRWIMGQMIDLIKSEKSIPSKRATGK